MNIIWANSENKVRVTMLTPGIDPLEHAKILKSQGDIEDGWEMVGFNIELPSNRATRDSWRWNENNTITEN